MEEKSIAQEMIEDRDKIIDKQFKLLSLVIVVFGLVITAIVMAFLQFLSGYTYDSTTKVEVSGDTGCAIYQDGKGNVINGKSCSDKEKNNDTKKTNN